MFDRFDKWMTANIQRGNSYTRRTLALMAGLLAMWPLMYSVWREGDRNLSLVVLLPLMAVCPFLFWVAPFMIWMDEREAAGKPDIAKAFSVSVSLAVLSCLFGFWVLVVMSGLWFGKPYEQFVVPVLLALALLAFVVMSALDLDRAICKLEAHT